MPEIMTTEEAFMRAAADANVWEAALVIEARSRIKAGGDPATVYAAVLAEATKPRALRLPRERQTRTP